MKKYKKAIKITGVNAAQLYACPVVMCITKLDEPKVVSVDGDVAVAETLSSVVVKIGLVRDSVAAGQYIVEDVCGHYEIMDAEKWNEVKDDVIAEEDDIEPSEAEDVFDGL